MIEGMSFGMKTAEGNEAVSSLLSKYLNLYQKDAQTANEYLHNHLCAISLTHPEVGDYNVRQNIMLLVGELDFLMDDEESFYFFDDECFDDSDEYDEDDLDLMEGSGGC